MTQSSHYGVFQGRAQQTLPHSKQNRRVKEEVGVIPQFNSVVCINSSLNYWSL